ncbi:anhydro-N-acetylmuramic acid kinase [Candidatus Sumerlaeota bacterium]|nr:anhydro-N-acetylmuramic acid kinase [Candidatus Sumerlaeota bacterium]
MTTLLGLNSGTSADGVDAVVVRFEGERPQFPLEILASVHRPYTDHVHEALARLFTEWNAPLDLLCSLRCDIGHSLTEAASAALSKAGLGGRDVDVCGSHGQTIYHLPPALAKRKGLTPSTWQIGDASIIADAIGCPVAFDFRAADVAAGGQGAPLTPILDHLLFTDTEKCRVRLNIGGIANLTWLPPGVTSDHVLAFDTGPGNILIDQTIQRLTGGAKMFDRDGESARTGTVHEGLLAEMLADPYFAMRPPKSTGREQFGPEWLGLIHERANEFGLSDADFLATLTELTSANIVGAMERHLPPDPAIDELILHGGGAKNPLIVEGLRRRLPETIRLATVEEFGIPLQALEPLLFAVLGWLCLRRVRVFYPRATGAKRPAVLGKMVFPT